MRGSRHLLANDLGDSDDLCRPDRRATARMPRSGRRRVSCRRLHFQLQEELWQSNTAKWQPWKWECGQFERLAVGSGGRESRELLNKEENRGLLDGLEEASRRVEMAKRELAEIEKQEIEAKLMRDYINQLESRASEVSKFFVIVRDLKFHYLLKLTKNGPAMLFPFKSMISSSNIGLIKVRMKPGLLASG
ncbi:hypothetical protein Sango_2325400 [Sesamum angolense]|uniref:Uncharacterized protein n=1 Tax=Sesamum angolense TaxID=2727404 RepID=A0AAE2BLL9_9LAMI|nr:hypothetical protein Sango_2325400 [Sesamum angolense]